jgi:hypothetical protein
MFNAFVDVFFDLFSMQVVVDGMTTLFVERQVLAPTQG